MSWDDFLAFYLVADMDESVVHAHLKLVMEVIFAALVLVVLLETLKS